MVDVSPFRGWRYDVSQVGDLSDVICPPYDVIDEALQDRLYRLHPCNVIRLELNRSEPGDAAESARYARAASFWKHWRLDGVLRQEPEETLYVYHQHFQWDGRDYVRKGFLARLRLEPFGSGQVFPHEQTLSGPKADRLALFQACRANLSPVFGLYPDPTNAVQQQLDDACLPLTPMEATDLLGVKNRLWAVQDVSVINALKESLRPRPVFIADGHHRYETGLNYQRELQQSGEGLSPHAAANFTMMQFVSMQDPGLQILPTHRLVSQLPVWTTNELRNRLQPDFELEWIGAGPQAGNDTWDLIDADGSQDVLGFGSVADGGWLLARLKHPQRMDELAADKSLVWRGLAVSRLHRLVLDRLLQNEEQGQPGKCQYVHQLSEVHAAMKQETCQVACLVPPARIEHVEQIAAGRETMPPKSTYFYPKLQTGLVFHALQ
jgi:uncharacterized protein (DUF1015 family)